MFYRLAWCSVLCALAVAIVSGCGEDTQSVPAAAPTAEARVRAELGIPPDAPRVFIFSQSSHLDWDWLRTFDEYYQRSVDGIFTDALGLLSQYHAAPHHYFYSIAEMGFLQRFVTQHPDLLQPLKDVGQDLRIVGGGITSPDNLLPSGEAFIRDYLVGKTWVDATLGLPIRQAWLPDDFGHDAQLPIVLEAMGFQGVGFARVPGVDTTLALHRTRAAAGAIRCRTAPAGGHRLRLAGARRLADAGALDAEFVLPGRSQCAVRSSHPDGR